MQVVTKQKLNGAANVIARTGADIIYRKGQPALALLDFDTKGMPGDVTTAMVQHGGYWPALVAVLPALQTAARVMRRSTSAGLFRSDTGTRLPGSDGVHVYVAVQDGTDVERFLKTLHARCWLAEFGWMMVGAGGQLLERSIVDRMVGAPERLVFEGGPYWIRRCARQGKPATDAIEGDALDTVGACLPLTIAETAQLRELKAKWAHRLAGKSAKVRTAFVAKQAKRLAETHRISMREAMRTIARQCQGILLRIWCCRSTTRISPDARSPTSSLTRTNLRAPRWPIRSKASTTGFARRG